METGTQVAANKWKFQYCQHLVGTDYDLNEGGKWGDLYCAASTAATANSIWKTWAEATTAGGTTHKPATYYDKTLDTTACV